MGKQITAEFRKKVVDFYFTRGHLNQRQVAEEFNIGQSTLHRWVALAKKDDSTLSKLHNSSTRVVKQQKRGPQVKSQPQAKKQYTKYSTTYEDLLKQHNQLKQDYVTLKKYHESEKLDADRLADTVQTLKETIRILLIDDEG